MHVDRKVTTGLTAYYDPIVIDEPARIDLYTKPYISRYNGRQVPSKWGGTMVAHVELPAYYTIAYPQPDYEMEVIRTLLDPEDRESWKEIRQSRRIKMTPWEASKRTRHDYRARLTFHRAVSYSTADEHESASVNGPFNGVALMTIQHYYDGWLKIAETEGWDINLSQDDAEDLRVRVQNRAIEKALEGYDLLTELAEAKSTMQSFLSLGRALRRPVKAVYRLAREMEREARKGSHKKLRDLWMSYRYEWGPIIASANDISSLLASKDNTFLTTRSRVTDDAYLSTKKGSGPQIYQVVTGVRIGRATVKSRFNPGWDRAIAQTRLNPLLTAWELVPYSFVIDWFLNVGDCIEAWTSALDVLVTRQGCSSIKTTVDTETRIYFPPQRTCEPGWSHFGVEFPEFCATAPEQDVLLRQEYVDAYDRKLFTTQDYRMTAQGPADAMSWRRSLDAYVLGLNNLKRALRSRH